jgi:hypothetical protein
VLFPGVRELGLTISEGPDNGVKQAAECGVKSVSVPYVLDLQ